MRKILKTLALVALTVAAVKAVERVKNKNESSIICSKKTGPSKVTITKKGIMTTK